MSLVRTETDFWEERVGFEVKFEVRSGVFLGFRLFCIVVWRCHRFSGIHHLYNVIHYSTYSSEMKPETIY